MEFTKYQSIDNSYRQKIINHLYDHGLSEGDWIATEKIHGCNFSIWCEGGSVSFAKRSGFIEKDENFYNTERLRNVLTTCMTKLYNTLWVKQLANNGDTVVVWGEQCGGSGNDAKTVQSQIWYSDDPAFLVFDISINGVYQSHRQVEALCRVVGFVTVPVVATGDLKFLLELDPEFNCTVTSKADNPAEGFVIKPAEVKHFGNGARVILKTKSKAFSEKKNKVPSKAPEPLCDADQLLLDELVTYVTKNRLKSVLSHIGDVGQKDFGKVIGLLVQDILVDYEKDYGSLEHEKAREDSEWKKVSRALSKECSALIRPNWVNILDGGY